MAVNSIAKNKASGILNLANTLSFDESFSIFAFYKEEKKTDLKFDDLKNYRFREKFVNFNDTTWGIELTFGDLESFKDSTLGIEIEPKSFYINLQGYDKNYKEIGEEKEIYVHYLKIKSFSYSDNKMDAVFYDLKKGSEIVVDTLKMSLDFQSLESFKQKLRKEGN